jgi:hypothetical protein
MDTLTAISESSPCMGVCRHLSLYINGVRLDEILSQKTQEDFRGLIPAWLDFYDESFEPSLKEKQYVRKQMVLSEMPVILPVLLCPDDFDFSCTVIVVEVICHGNTVVWNRFGADVTPFDMNEEDLPKYIGKKVNWFTGAGPYHFLKSDYLSCLSNFIVFY